MVCFSVILKNEKAYSYILFSNKYSATNFKFKQIWCSSLDLLPPEVLEEIRLLSVEQEMIRSYLFLSLTLKTHAQTR